MEIDSTLAAGLSHRFRIVRRLGEGGMGAVFLAEQMTVGNRPVALKVLNRNLLDNPDFLQRFQNEAASTGRIHHPNVVTIYESGQADDGTPYIAMEFLEGESLRQALSRRGALPVPEVAEILQQAARGLNAAHKLGIIHRDLKPDNIFLTRSDDLVGEGSALPREPGGLPYHSGGPSPPLPMPREPAGLPYQVKIVDFGIAKLRESATHTQTGMVLGTPAYMSYEQASGMKSDELDARSDIYSLGVVTYEMLTGRVPFQSDTPVGYLRMHLQDAPPPFRAVKPDLPALPEVESVVMKALTKDRARRYGSVLEFAHEFAEAERTASGAVRGLSRSHREPPLHDEAAMSQPAAPLVAPSGGPQRVAKPQAAPIDGSLFSPRQKRAAAIGCLALMAAAMSVGLVYWLRLRSRAAQGQFGSPAPVTFAPFVLERTLTGEGVVTSVAFSPDGKCLASGALDERVIKLWDAASWSLKQTLRGQSNYVTSVAFSPDGQLIASGAADENTIKLWDVTSAKLKRTLTGHGDAVISVAFSPDGELLASASVDKTVKLWDVFDGALRQTLTGHSPVYCVAFAPDGKLLSSAGYSHTVNLWDVASGTLRQSLTGHNGDVGSVVFRPDGSVLASGSRDGTIELWDVATGEIRQTLRGHADLVHSVAFSPDGRILASGSSDNTIKLWDAASGGLRQTLTGHAKSVLSVTFSPDGMLLVSGGSDKTIKLWRRGLTATSSVGREAGVEATPSQVTRNPGEVRENPKDALKYVWIPPGTYIMGCAPGGQRVRGK